MLYMGVKWYTMAAMKRDGRHLDHKTLETFRLMALQRLQEGESARAVMESYGLCRTTIYKWKRKARGRRGMAALLSRKGTGRPRRLTAAQERRVLGWINGKDPRQYGFDFGLWTRNVVGQLIKDKFGVGLSLASIGTMLARLGLTPQKPLQRAYERDPEAIEAWKAKTYPKLAARARKLHADIYFWDEAGFRADAVQGRTWGRRGRTPVLAVPGQRQTVSAASAVNAKGAFWFVTYKGGLNAELFVGMLKLLMRRRRTPLFLVLDNLATHKAKVVAQYVAATKGKLELHFLPGYAPDLNPDELVWNHMKRTGTARRPLGAGESLQDNIEADMRAIQRNRRLVRSFFHAETVAYITD
jgi:transposase